MLRASLWLWLMVSNDGAGQVSDCVVGYLANLRYGKIRYSEMGYISDLSGASHCHTHTSKVRAREIMKYLCGSR
jgi:hypothetical protein